MKTVNHVIGQLESNAHVFSALFANLDKEQAHWKPSEEHWCLLEVVCHLVDEEILDFRTRVKTALYPTQFKFEPIDPAGWVKSKAYMSKDYESEVSKFLDERKTSIEWLKGLENPDWSSSLIHSELGEMSALKFLENWLAHDCIHINQINRIKRAYLNSIAVNDLSYAGKWRNY